MVNPVGLARVTIVIDMLKRKNARTVIRYLFVLFLGSIMSSLSCNYAMSSSATQAVETYCQLDYTGARLTGVGYNKMRNLMAWDEDQGEPGWDCFKIISSYKISNEKVSENEATVTVMFNIVAQLCSDFILERKNYSDVVSVSLIRNKKGWKIRNYIPFPRISVATAVTYFESLAEKKRSSEDVEKLKLLIIDLKKLKDEQTQ